MINIHRIQGISKDLLAFNFLRIIPLRSFTSPRNFLSNASHNAVQHASQSGRRAATRAIRKRFYKKQVISSNSDKMRSKDEYPREVVRSYFPDFEVSQEARLGIRAKFNVKYFRNNNASHEHMKAYLNAMVYSKLDHPDPLVIQCNNSGANDYIESLVSSCVAEDFDLVVINREDLVRLMYRSDYNGFPFNPKPLPLVLKAEDVDESDDGDEAEEEDGEGNNDVEVKGKSVKENFNDLLSIIKDAVGNGGEVGTVIAVNPSSSANQGKSNGKGSGRLKNPLESAFESMLKYLRTKEKPTAILFKDVGLLSPFEQKNLYDAYIKVFGTNNKLKEKVVCIFAWTPDLKEYSETGGTPNYTSGGLPPPTVLQSFLSRKSVIHISNELNADDKGWQDLMEEGKENRRIDYNKSLLETECIRRNVSLLLSNEDLILNERLLQQKEASELISLARGFFLEKNKNKAIRLIKDEDLINAMALYEKTTASPIIAPSETEDMGPIQKVNKIMREKRLTLNSYEKKLMSTIVTPEVSGVKFKDIACLKKTKETLQSIIALPLLRPSFFQHGVLKNTVSGVLLFGPPGTGKTMLAKALAAECGSNFMNITASVIFNMYVGEGEKNVKAIFTLARKLAPCVVFIDEVDSIFEARGSTQGYSTKREVVNEFMSEWDGLVSKNNGIIVVGATNRPFDLDDAILRRMPRRILVDTPNKKEREGILRVHLRDEKLSDDVVIEDLAEKTIMYSGSDLKNVCLNAAMNSVKDILVEENKTFGNTDLVTQDGTLNVIPEAKLTHSVPPRILKKSHFDLALKEISSSLDEKKESLEKLREWSKKYGENSNDQKAKKSSFGFNLPEIS